jgi:hypothetical protein
VTLEQYAYLAQIIGAIVVVATLIYLSLQVRQGAHLMRSESRQALLSNTREHLMMYLDNVELFDKLAGDERLSQGDQLRFSVIWITNMRLREHEWFQYRDGILDEPTWMSYQKIIRLTLSSKRHRAWWEKMKGVFDPGFVEIVDQFIRQTPESNIFDENLRGWDKAA